MVERRRLLLGTYDDQRAVDLAKVSDAHDVVVGEGSLAVFGRQRLAPE